MAEPKSEFIFYKTEDQQTRLQVRLEGETVWLTQAQMAELFQRERSVITKHIHNVFEEGELVEAAVCANHAQTAADGKTYQTVYYNLDVIISVGYRVKSRPEAKLFVRACRLRSCGDNRENGSGNSDEKDASDTSEFPAVV